MYCTKCGKQIDYDSPICRECADELAAAPAETVEPAIERDAIEQPEQTELQPGQSVEVAPHAYVAEPVKQPVAPSIAPVGNLRMRGFGKALTSTILGFVGYFFAVFTIAMLGVAIEEGDPAAGVVMFILSLPLTIIPFVFALKSIGLFRSTPSWMPKPVVTLILGIVGLFFAALSLLFLSIALIILLGALALV